MLNCIFFSRPMPAQPAYGAPFHLTANPNKPGQNSFVFKNINSTALLYTNTETAFTVCSEADKLPYTCNYNLTDTVAAHQPFQIIYSTGWLSYYKTNRDTVYEWKDVSYNAEELCDPGDFCLDSVEQLKYIGWYPDYPYSTCNVLPPVVIFFHPGGFSDCTSIEDAGHLYAIAQQMAHQGFICIVVEYRRGRVLSDTLAKPGGRGVQVYYTTSQQDLCYYRAFQDVRGAIRTIIKRNREAATPYKFDRTNIGLAGFSAGAICVINAAFYPTQAMINQVDQGAHNVLGPIDADYYYGEPTIEYHSKIFGLSNGWGNAFIPLNYVTHPQDFFPASDSIPVISFHGKLDWEVCPYDYQNVYFADTGKITNIDPAFPGVVMNPETRCLPDGRVFYLNSGVDPGGPNNNDPPPDIDAYRFGSKKIYCFLKSLGVYTELYMDPQMHHGVQMVPPDDFGTGYTNEADVFSYIGGRIATFFQAILYNKTHPGFLNTLKTKRTYFEDCVNNRDSCSTVNNNACTVPEPPGVCN